MDLVNDKNIICISIFSEAFIGHPNLSTSLPLPALPPHRPLEYKPVRSVVSLGLRASRCEPPENGEDYARRQLSVGDVHNRYDKLASARESSQHVNVRKPWLFAEE